MFESISFLFSGIFFGLIAGISPGPLQALIFSETIKYGRSAGIKVAISPLFTDIVIVTAVMLLLLYISGFDIIIGFIALAGAGYLIYLGIENLRLKEVSLKAEQKDRNSLVRGIITNALSPHPYIFWLSIGGTMMIKGWEISVFSPVLFLVGFYSLLIGTKVGMVFLTDKAKTFIKSKYYVTIIKVLGVLLIVFALFFVWDGLGLLGIL